MRQLLCGKTHAADMMFRQRGLRRACLGGGAVHVACAGLWRCMVTIAWQAARHLCVLASFRVTLGAYFV